MVFRGSEVYLGNLLTFKVKTDFLAVRGIENFNSVALSGIFTQQRTFQPRHLM
jgi:hypothetical protein